MASDGMVDGKRKVTSTLGTNKVAKSQKKDPETNKKLDSSTQSKLVAGFARTLVELYKKNNPGGKVPQKSDIENLLKTAISDILKSSNFRVPIKELSESINNLTKTDFNKFVAEFFSNDASSQQLFKGYSFGKDKEINKKLKAFLTKHLKSLASDIKTKSAKIKAAAALLAQKKQKTQGEIEQAQKTLHAELDSAQKIDIRTGDLLIVTKSYTELAKVSLQYSGKDVLFPDANITVSEEERNSVGETLKYYYDLLKNPTTTAATKAKIISDINSLAEKMYYSNRVFNKNSFSNQTEAEAAINLINTLFKGTASMSLDAKNYLLGHIPQGISIPNLKKYLGTVPDTPPLSPQVRQKIEDAIKQTAISLLPQKLKMPSSFNVTTGFDLARLFGITKAKPTAKDFTENFTKVPRSNDALAKIALIAALGEALVTNNFAQSHALMSKKTSTTTSGTPQNPKQVSEEYKGTIPTAMKALHDKIEEYEKLAPNEHLYPKTSLFSFSGGDSAYDVFRKEGKTAQASRIASEVKMKALGFYKRKLSEIASLIKTVLNTYSSSDDDSHTDLLSALSTDQTYILSRLSETVDGPTLGKLYGSSGALTRSSSMKRSDAQSIITTINNAVGLITDRSREEMTRLQDASQATNTAYETLMKFIQKMFDTYKVLLQ